jgi:hypothetical protein
MYAICNAISIVIVSAELGEIFMCYPGCLGRGRLSFKWEPLGNLLIFFLKRLHQLVTKYRNFLSKRLS